jgi:uroporphyrinogen-III synthase
MTAPVVVHTGPADRAERWLDAIRAAGFEVRALPAIESRPVPLAGADRDAVIAAAPYAVVLVTSPRAADSLGGFASWIADAAIAAVGSATAEACARAGFPAKWTGGSGGRMFVGMLAERGDLAGKAVLFPRGDLAQESVAAALAGRGARVVAPVVYRTVAVPQPPAAVQAATAGLAGVTFTSPSGVRSFAASAEAAGVLRAAREAFAATTGPATEARALKAGFRWRGVARRPGPEALAALLVTVLKT